MTFLTRQMFNDYEDLPTEDVSLPELGAGVVARVRCLTAEERLQFVQAQVKSSNPVPGEAPGPNPTALLVVLGSVAEDGTNLYTLQDVDWLAQRRGDVIERLAGEVAKLSKLSGDDAKDAEGNSDATPSGDSPSDSAETSAAPASAS